LSKLGSVDASVRRGSGSMYRRTTALLRADTTAVVGTVIGLNLLRIISTMVLTRLLNADAYGVVGIVTSVAVVFALISDIGVVAFVVRHEQGLSANLLDEIWTIRLARSIALTVAMALLANPIAQFMQKPELHWPLVLGSLTFLLDGASSMAIATALREKLVKRLSLIDLVASLFVFAVSALLAWLWGNFWAILVTSLMGQALRALLTYVWFDNSGRRIRFSRERMAELWGFSRYITGSTMITLVLSQTDKLILSRVFTLDVLGLYILGSNLATAAAGLATAYASRVLYPHLAECWRERPEALRGEFYAKRMPISMLYMVAVGGAMGAAGLIVAILYDERYADAAVFFQILSISTVFAINNQATNELMIASGRQFFTFHANIIRLIYLILISYPAYAGFGIRGLIVVIGSIELVAQLYGWLMLFRHRLLQWRDELMLLMLAALGIGAGLVLNGVGLSLLR
jgi:lipopolysaccharide exporter